MNASVLVTDAEERAALAVVRSLGRAGARIHVCSHRSSPLAGASRYASTVHDVPDPLRDAADYAARVAELCRSEGVDVLLPITEASLLAVLPRRQMLGATRLPFPPSDTFRRVCDKDEVLRVARTIGIAVPRQQVVESAEAWPDPAALELSLPIVLKPSRSVAAGEQGGAKLSVVHASSERALERARSSLPEGAYPLLIQERITGAGVGIFLLLWEGRLLAWFAHRRIREKPPSGGVSVYRESVEAPADLVARSRELLEALEWSGVAMVEYKLDGGGRPVLMEINGRFWGSLQLAIDAGVDFPLLLVRACLGDMPEPVTSYRTGIRSRWWWGDADHLLTRLRRSRQALHLGPEEPGRIRAAASFLIPWRPGDRSEILRLSDPAPFLRETAAWLRHVVRRRAGRGKGGG